MNKNVWITFHDADLFKINKSLDDGLTFSLRNEFVAKMLGGGLNDIISIVIYDVSCAFLKLSNGNGEKDLLKSGESLDVDFEILNAGFKGDMISVILKEGSIDMLYGEEAIVFRGNKVNVLDYWKGK